MLVAMSGGVDSSVAAAMLHEQGYRVLGSHMKLVHLDGVDHGCCGPQAEKDAAAVAELAGFEFEIADMNAEFERTVLADFYAEHRAGRTPNPCVRCNEHIKFRAFLDRADGARTASRECGSEAVIALPDQPWATSALAPQAIMMKTPRSGR